MAVNWEDPRSAEESTKQYDEQGSEGKTNEVSETSETNGTSEVTETSETNETSSGTTSESSKFSPPLQSLTNDSDTDTPTEGSGVESSTNTNSGGTSGGTGGFMGDGRMSWAETVGWILFSFASLWTAYSILMVSVNHGLHHTPIQLWAAVLGLLAAPLFVLMGTGVGERFFRMMVEYRSSSTNHDK